LPCAGPCVHIRYYYILVVILIGPIKCQKNIIRPPLSRRSLQYQPIDRYLTPSHSVLLAQFKTPQIMAQYPQLRLSA